MGSCHMQSSRNCSRSETILEKKFWPIFSFFIFYWYGMLINIFNDKYPITRVCIYWIIQHIGICNWWPHYCKSVTPWHEKNKRKIYDRRYIYKVQFTCLLQSLSLPLLVVISSWEMEFSLSQSMTIRGDYFGVCIEQPYKPMMETWCGFFVGTAIKVTYLFMNLLHETGNTQ